MEVYLDNNIIVDIESRGLSLDSLFIQNVNYRYSAAHIDEMSEGENKGVNVIHRLKTIDRIASSNYIDGIVQPEFFRKDPHCVYVERKQNVILNITKMIINNSVREFNVDRDRFVGLLDWRKEEVNNIAPKDIMERLNNAMMEKLNVDIPLYLKSTEASGITLYHTLFNLLDFACFHKDKKGDHVNIARMYDAFHAYYASICDIFVSRDKRMRYKTMAVYHYLGVKTKVMDLKEYIDYLQEKKIV